MVSTAFLRHRIPARGTYDKAQIDGILKEGLTCHVAFVAEGRPVCIPMIYAQLEDRLYIHGSIASRLLKSMKVALIVKTCSRPSLSRFRHHIISTAQQLNVIMGNVKIAKRERMHGNANHMWPEVGMRSVLLSKSFYIRTVLAEGCLGKEGLSGEKCSKTQNILALVWGEALQFSSQALSSS